jgi:hypothetical protein
MMFRFKDLLVIDIKDAVGKPPCYCTHCTDDCTNCSCSKCTENCTASAVEFDAVINPGDINLLRTMLRYTLESIETAERTSKNSLLQILSDVELAEARLVSLLKEVRARKLGIRQKSSK